MRVTSRLYPRRVLFGLLVACVVLFVVLPFLSTTFWGVVSALLVGLVLGALARVIAPGSGRMSLTLTTLLGVCGSALGTIGARALDTGGFGQLLLQVLAATGLVMVVRPRKKVRR